MWMEGGWLGNMEDKKTLLILGGILVATLALITGFAFLASQPAKPIQVEIGNAFFKWSKEAKVEIVEFSDFECPVCQRFAVEVLPQLEQSYKDKVKFVYKFFPLYETHKLANLSARSAYCAGRENKFWEYHNMLMTFPSYWKDKPERFLEYAQNLGLNMEGFKKCQESTEAQNAVLSDRQQGERLGVSATPSFFVNGEKIVGLQGFEVWKSLLDNKLK